MSIRTLDNLDTWTERLKKNGRTHYYDMQNQQIRSKDPADKNYL